jgi:hypothetical protein
VGAQLLRTLFDGPQALSLADVASPSARRLWERLGGVTVACSSLAWIRALRPVRQLVASVVCDPVPAWAGRLLEPLDALGARLLPVCHRPAVPARGTPWSLTEAHLLDCLANLDGRAI